MNVSQQNIDNVNAVITIEIAKADYQEQVDKTLRGYRQKANIPGFRKGMAPAGMINKMFGKQVLADEINKKVGESLFGYIRENNLNVLGEPLPSLEQPAIDFDTQEDFTFSFDIALAPAIKLELSKEDKVAYYNVEVSEEMINTQIDAIKNRFGKQDQEEEAIETDIIKGDLAELDADGNIKEGGIVVEEASVMPKYFKNDEQKAKFEGAKKLSTLEFNPSQAVDANANELASILKMKAEEVEGVTSNFRFTINEILRFVPAEENEELYKNAFGEECTTKEAFVAKIKEAIEEQLVPEQDYRFGIDARQMIETKVGELEMPVEMLKRWMVATNEGRTMEQVEEEMPKMLPELKWHLIKEYIAKNNDVKVEDNDILEIAKKATRAQFAQYGMANVPEELLENYAKQMMQNKEAVRNLVDRATEDKIIAKIKELVSLDEKSISVEDFQKLFEA